MVISDSAPRGTQAVFAYDGSSYGVLHNPQFGTIEFDTSGIGAEWNSGEPVTVSIFDPDMNLDSRSADDLVVTSNATIVPAIKVGSPITLATLKTLKSDTQNSGTVTLDQNLNYQCSSDYGATGATTSSNPYTSCYEKYSERSLITTENDPSKFTAQDAWFFTHSSDTTVKTFKDLIANANGTGAYTYVQYDFRGMNNGTDNLSFGGNFTFGDTSMGSPTAATQTTGDIGFYQAEQSGILTPSASVGAAQFTGLVGNVAINTPTVKIYGLDSLTESNPLQMKVLFVTVDNTIIIGDGKSMPLSVDVVTWGQSNDGTLSSDRHNNAIYRLEASEASNDAGIYEGTVEYVMLNQLNVNKTHSNIHKLIFGGPTTYAEAA
jgi:hypothetical protein